MIWIDDILFQIILCRFLKFNVNFKFFKKKEKGGELNVYDSSDKLIKVYLYSSISKRTHLRSILINYFGSNIISKE